MRYEIRFRNRAKRALKTIPKQTQKRIFDSIKALADNPFPPGYKKLKGRDGYRIRQGNYRIIYEINQSEIYVLILAIGNRKDIYSKNFHRS